MAENLSRFEGLITTDDLDELLDDPTTDPATLVGKKVNWHYTHVLPIVKLHDGGLYLKMRLACGKCGKRTKTVYLGSGLHSGAWCYAYDHNGQYRANLRDQEFVCQECFAKRNQGGAE